MGTKEEYVANQVQSQIETIQANVTAFIDASGEILDQLKDIPTQPPFFTPNDIENDVNEISIDAIAPTRPDLEGIDEPAEPVITDTVVPDLVEPTQPTAPVLRSIALPDVPTISLPVFDLEFPQDELEEPDVMGFEFNEQEYYSQLLEAVKAKLLSDVVNGGTGLSPEVEDAIWRRDEERLEVAYQEAIQKTSAMWAKSGYSLPNGSLQAAVQDVVLRHEMDRLTRSREIAIKQAELAQTNTHFAITSSLTLENLLIQHHNNVQNRALEVAKSTIQFAIALFNVSVERLRMKYEAYKANAESFEARVRAELSKVEIFKAQMDGAKLELAVGQQESDNYRTQLMGVEMIYNNYKAKLDGIRTKAEIDKEKMMTYRTQLEAKLDKIRSLISIYSADMSAYSTAIDKGAKVAELKMDQKRLSAEIAKINLDYATKNAENNINAFIKTSELKSGAIQATAGIYGQVASAAQQSLSSITQLSANSQITANE